MTEHTEESPSSANDTGSGSLALRLVSPAIAMASLSFYIKKEQQLDEARRRIADLQVPSFS